MAMRFRYKLISVGHAVVSLGGRWVRSRPIIAVSLTGPGGTYAADGLLDSAADDTVFPEKALAPLGLDLTNAPRGVASGVGMVPLSVRYAQVMIHVTDGKERREWTAWVGFAPPPFKRPLLGFAGFLQFFQADFHGDLEFVELQVNQLYSGN